MTLTRDDVIDVLTAIAAFDRRTIGEGDITAWGAALRPDLDRQLALDAVRIHNATSGDWIKPVHVNTLAVQIRKDRADRENRESREAREDRNDVRHGITPPDTQLGGLPIGGADGDPLWDAYDINAAIDRDCPTCDQPRGCACVNPVNDSARKIPCLARLKAVA